MKAIDLIHTFPELETFQIDIQKEIQYIQSDSRKIQIGDLFVLYPEYKDSASQYISHALEKGAVGLVLPKGFFYELNNKDYLVFQVEDTRKYHGLIASFLAGEPSKKLKILAVTGTNGKTSITHILYYILSSLGKKVGLIGTIYAKYGNVVYETGYTTPDSSSLNLILKEMLEAGVEYVCLEASSHGLKLGRLDGIHFYAGIFTNLTPDHLDFHPTMEDYLLSKFKLFEFLEKSSHTNKIAVISLDSPGGKDMQALVKKLSPTYNVIYFGKEGHYSGSLEELTLNYTSFFIYKNNISQKIVSNLLGKFNFENLALVYLLLVEIFPQLDQSEIISLFKSIPNIPGRFEVHSSPNKEKIAIVDYAHTPDALENILLSLREIPSSMLITVFGCGGDRDRKKRPLMGEIACRYSDLVIITSDNPRTENPSSIITEITTGIPKDFKRYLAIENRREAIQKAIKILPKGGILLVAGKGHENYQIIGNKKFHFSDAEEIETAFSQLERENVSMDI